MRDVRDRGREEEFMKGSKVRDMKRGGRGKAMKKGRKVSDTERERGRKG